jgi:hypothetical protein
MSKIKYVKVWKKISPGMQLVTKSIFVNKTRIVTVVNGGIEVDGSKFNWNGFFTVNEPILIINHKKK